MTHRFASSRRGFAAALAAASTFTAAPAALAAEPLALTSRVDAPVASMTRLADRTAVADFNGDGIDDHAIAGASGATVYFGARGSVDGGGTLQLTLDGGWAGAVGVSSAGDPDGDGFDDLLLLAQKSAKRVYLLHGAPSNPATLDVATAARTTTINPGAWVPTDTRALGIGDFNGDGLDDVIVPTANGAISSAGPSGIAIVAGGPRVASIDASKAGGRVSRLTGYRKCSMVFIATWPFFVNQCFGADPVAAPVGDINGDGLDDLYVNGSQGRSESIVLGRSTGGFTTSALSPAAPTLGLNALPVGGAGRTALPIGDVTGDGIADFTAGGGIVRGRADLPASLTSDEPILNIEEAPGVPNRLLSAAGDQNGDGRGDLLLARGEVFGRNPELVVASLPAGATAFTLGAQVPVGGGRPSGPIGVAASLTQGDLDGDGLVDAIVADHEAAYRLTHAAATTTSRLRARTVYVDWRGASYRGGPSTVTAVCEGVTTTQTVPRDSDAVFGADDSLSIGDGCTLSSTQTPPLQNDLAGCVWEPSYRFRGETVSAGARLTLASEPNLWEQTLTCATPPVGQEQLPGDTFAGWTLSGGATSTAAKLMLTDRANQTASAVWPHPINPNGKRFVFEMHMDGGNGSAEGVALAFLDNVGGKPSGLVGSGGGQLGFGGLSGQALVFDAFKQPEDPKANMIYWVDGPQGASLNKRFTADAGLRLRGNTLGLSIEVRDGKIFAMHNGRLNVIEATLPDSVFVAVTASTSTVWQKHYLLGFDVQRLG